MYNAISFEEANKYFNTHKIVLTYFSTNDCNVCKVLKPKVKELIEYEFPLINFLYINVNESKEIAAQFSVFAIPTIILFIDGKEYIRKSRFINLEELKSELDRIYNLIF
ncbi:MAG: thioredoxin family protein [Melioribacter sp.]|uniref:thioredoxin family protein n=1 Tax=Rosettibacter primus TaxID=3111523 RepID=UPI00247ED5E7|nr:thioredoxin family protein [Melioribacter sp.]